MTLNEAFATLEKKGFRPRLFDNSDEVKKALLEEIPTSASVGIGGSSTINGLGIEDELLARGNAVYWHWRVPVPERPEVIKRAFSADYYLMSANAIASDGTICNIDGNGNRVGTMLCGRGKLIMVVGKNKLTDGDPIERIKKYACPKNAVRLGLDTPCAKLGYCTDCKAKDRMCNITVRLPYPPSGRDMQVWLVDEELGF